MQNGFIEKAVSRITSKQRRNLVSAELYDHIDEKEKFFKEIGYDDIASSDRANAVMGDAELIGEQLDIVGKSFFKSNSFLYTFSGVSLLLMITAYILLSRTDISGSFSSVYINFYYIISPLFSFCMFSIIFILGAVNLLFGNKKKNAVSLTIGFIMCETVIIIGPYHYLDLLYCVINKKNFIESFFMNTDVMLMARNIISGYEIIMIICAITIFFIFAFSLTIIIKTKQLNNTKKDLRIKKSLFAITATIAFFWTLCSVSITGLVFINKDEIYNKFYNEFCNIEKIIVTHIDDFASRDYIRINKLIDDAVKAYGSGISKNSEDLTAPIWTNGYITISEYYYFKGYSDEYYSENEEAPEEISVSMHCEIMNPFGFRQSQYDIYSNAQGNSRSIKTVPLPAQMNFYSDRQGSNVTFAYGSGAYFPKNITYDYNLEEEHFEITSDSFSNFETKVELNRLQLIYLEQALKKYSGFNYVICDIYGIYQSDRFSNLYKIDLSYAPYDTETSHIYYTTNHESTVFGASMIVEFGEDYAQIIHYYAPHTNEYNTFDELITIIEDYYNIESLKEIKKIH